MPNVGFKIWGYTYITNPKWVNRLNVMCQQNQSESSMRRYVIKQKLYKRILRDYSENVSWRDLGEDKQGVNRRRRGHAVQVEELS